jgi:hypothetical protein
MIGGGDANLRRLRVGRDPWATPSPPMARSLTLFAAVSLILLGCAQAGGSGSTSPYYNPYHYQCTGACRQTG